MAASKDIVACICVAWVVDSHCLAAGVADKHIILETGAKDQANTNVQSPSPLIIPRGRWILRKRIVEFIPQSSSTKIQQIIPNEPTLLRRP
jgi:hypothetical protein